MRWTPYTFVRTVLFFIGGIVLSFYYPDLLPVKSALIFIPVLSVLYVATARNRRSLGRKFNPGWIALPLVFLMGYFHLIWQTESRRSDHLINNTEEISYFRAEVTRFPEERERSWKVEARVTALRTSRWKQASGKILLYFPKSAFPEPFRYGDILVVKGHPHRPEAPANPGEFDFGQYLAFQNIYHQHFVRKESVVKAGHDPANVFRDLAYRARHAAVNILKKVVTGEQEQAIAIALVLGVTDGLDNELLRAYSAAGTMHILAVSGLHISVIYLILLRLFAPLNKVARGRWIVAFLSLGLLWFYAFVTGLSPSVLRAVAMFSFLAIAKPWARSTNVYNTLAVSAFCLLLYDPFLVFSVGFQLSYLAVLGIVYLYPRILNSWDPMSTFAVEIWKLSAVSLAAQLATFPLGLLYFHQFPNYFLLSNLVIVPLSFVVLIAGLLIVVLSFVPVIISGLGFCLTWIIRFLNGIVFAMEDLPFSLTDGIYINPWQCALLMATILFVLALFEYRRLLYLVVACMTLLLFVGVQWVHFFKHVDQEIVTVYKIPGHTAMDLIHRGQVTFLTDSSLLSDEDKIRYHVVPQRILAGATNESGRAVRHAFPGGELVVWNQAKILLLSDSDFRLPSHVVVDWVIVGNNAVTDIGKLASRVACKKIVLDSSNSFFFAVHFLEAAKLYKLDVHSVLHQGAFISPIQTRDS